eukprot:Seg122.9 transcript_id=Seg122.9/GoldUCD/mRNA.D3Y31 product="hypothetical protein" protein_id=Seg122.9/GoldUCD/D3Y31
MSVSGVLPPVPGYLVNVIKKKKFVDFVMLRPCNLDKLPAIEPAGPQLSRLLKCEKGSELKPIQSFVERAEAWAVYAGVVSLQQPDWLSDLIGYFLLIAKTSRDTASVGWLEYDRAFRKKAAEDPGLIWSAIDLSLYVSMVLGRANNLKLKRKPQLDLSTQDQEKIIRKFAWDLIMVHVLSQIFYLDLFPHVDKDWVLHGLNFGFSLDIEYGSPLSAESNCKSALIHNKVINDYSDEEIGLGSITGPFEMKPIQNLQINRFEVIPKSAPGKWQLITDLSFPIGKSVNSFIPDNKASVSYEGIPEAIDAIMRLGSGAMMAKFDIKRAYRLLPVNTVDRKFLGLK